MSTVIAGLCVLFILYNKSLAIKQVIVIIRRYFLPLTGTSNLLKAAHFAYDVHSNSSNN